MGLPVSIRLKKAFGRRMHGNSLYPATEVKYRGVGGFTVLSLKICSTSCGLIRNINYALLVCEVRIMSVKPKWEDPAKRPAKPETMNTPGDFREFTDLMKKIVGKPKPASHGSAGD